MRTPRRTQKTQKTQKTASPRAHAPTTADTPARLSRASQAASPAVQLSRGARRPGSAVLQLKPAVNRPGDRYEREADRVADTVMRMQDSDAASAPDRAQPSPGGASASSVASASSADGVARGGTPLSSSLRSFFEPRFGRDFSAVRVHTSAEASRTSRSLNARAFTYGPDIHFGPNEYRPHSAGGRRLLAHELAHTAQQGHAPRLSRKASDDTRGATAGATRIAPPPVRQTPGPAVQRLIKSHHPWSGVVVDTPSLALREAPRNGATTLADLPSETIVEVLNETGGWLSVNVDTTQSGVVLNQEGRSRKSGDTLDGYSYHRYIDDAVSVGMTRLLGEEATWKPSGPSPLATDFSAWAMAATEGAAPPVEAVTTINCWEMILLAAYQMNVISWQDIHDLYTASAGAGWYTYLENQLIPSHETTYTSATADQLERGNIVLFDGAAHVALATGNGDEVFTFWPPPNTAFTAGGTLDDVKTSTIKDLSSYMTAHPRMSTPTVTFGPPEWSNW